MSHFNDDIISKVLFTVINASVFTIFNCNQPYLQPYFTKFLLSRFQSTQAKGSVDRSRSYLRITKSTQTNVESGEP